MQKHTNTLLNNSDISASRALRRLTTAFLILIGIVVSGVLPLIFKSVFDTKNEQDLQTHADLIGKQFKISIERYSALLHGFARTPSVIRAAESPNEQQLPTELSLGRFNHKLSVFPSKGGAIRHQVWRSALINSERTEHSAITRRENGDYFWSLAVPITAPSREITGILEAEISLYALIEELSSLISPKTEALRIYQGKELIIALGPDIKQSPTIYTLNNPSMILEYRTTINPSADLQKQLTKNIIYALLITLLCSVLLFIRISRSSFVFPLERLRAMTTALAQGKRVFPEVIITRIREIQMLVRDFRHMATMIREREERLYAEHEMLEERIAERVHELKESHDRIATILKTIQSGIMIINLETQQIVEVNEAFSEMIGLSKKKIVGRSCSEFSNCPKEYDGCYCRDHQTKLPHNEENLLTASDGSKRTVLKNSTAFILGGKPHMLVSFVDITKRKDNEKIVEEARRNEVRMAANIQEKLLMGTPPNKIGNVLISAMTLPSQTVSGDFYDFYKWHIGGMGMDLIIGDVMGKGINAALLGAGLKSAWHEALAIVLEDGGRAGAFPHAIVQNIHKEIVPELIKFESFITLCYARLSIENQVLEYVHCGHTQIIHWKDQEKQCELLEGTSPPLGLLEEETYRAQTESFLPGDCFVFFSDGITETENEKGEMFGIDRLCSVISENHTSSPKQLVIAIHREAALFSDMVGNIDDLTCIVLKITPITPGQETILSSV